jgi:hypothetical protein
VERILEGIGNTKLRVLVVWEPILPTDWNKPSNSTLARISDPRAMQFWDEKHLVAEELRRSVEANPSQPKAGCCEDNGFLWDMAALYAPQTRWNGTLPPAAFFDGPVVRVAPALDARLKENQGNQ